MSGGISDVEFSALLSSAKKVLTFTGAGVSVASGLPAFRGNAGWFTAIKKRYHVGTGIDLLNYDQVFKPYLSSLAYEKLPSTAKLEGFYAFAGDFRLKMLQTKPSRFHRWLAQLARKGRLQGAITTNIDDLEHSAGVPGNKLIQMHGSMGELICGACGELVTFTKQMAEDCAAGGIPFHTNCPRVKGTRTRPGKALRINIFRPHVLLYGNDPLNGTLFDPSAFPKVVPGTLLVIAGASLPTPEIRRVVKSLVAEVHHKGGQVVIANKKRITTNLGAGVLQWLGDLGDFPTTCVRTKSRSLSRSRSRSVKTKSRSRSLSVISVLSHSPARSRRSPSIISVASQ